MDDSALAWRQSTVVSNAPPPRRAFGASTVQAQSRGGLLRALGWIVGVAIVVGGGWLAWNAYQGWKGLGHDPVYEPEFPRNLAEVDLARVHHELWADWALALEHRYEMHNAEDKIAERTTALREAIAPDKNLSALFAELDALVTEGKLRNHAKRARALWLTRAWNQYLDEGDRRFFLKAFVAFDPNPEFHVYAYEVVAEVEAKVDDAPQRVRLVSRIDELIRRELFHASTPSEGAVLRVDWPLQFALDQVWPVFGPEEPQASRRKLYRAAVLAEASAALPADVIATLTATATARAEAVRAHAEIRSRRRCSRYAIPRLPWDGYDGDVLASLAQVVAAGRCPPVYASEFKALDDSRTVLAETENLEEAVQALAAWVLRPAIIHELRHVDSGIDIYDEDQPVPCSICAADDTPVFRAEVRSVVSEWAWTDSPALALFAACHDEEGTRNAAIRVGLKGLDWSCARGPHADLNPAARALEISAFGGSTAIVVDTALSRPLQLDRAVVKMRESQ